MSAINLESVDRIIEEMRKGTSIMALVPLDLDRAALARALEEIREDYEMRRVLDGLPTQAMKRGHINGLHMSARRFKDRLSEFLKGDQAVVELLTRAACHDRGSADQDKPCSPAATLKQLEHDVDALVRWTDIILKVNEKPEPAEGSPKEREEEHLRFRGWQELPGDETLRWLVADAIPRLLREFFHREARASRGTREAGGPSVRFAQAVLRELGAVSLKTGKPLAGSAIADYWKRSRHQG